MHMQIKGHCHFFSAICMQLCMPADAACAALHRLASATGPTWVGEEAGCTAWTDLPVVEVINWFEGFWGREKGVLSVLTWVNTDCIIMLRVLHFSVTCAAVVCWANTMPC